MGKHIKAPRKTNLESMKTGAVAFYSSLRDTSKLGEVNNTGDFLDSVETANTAINESIAGHGSIVMPEKLSKLYEELDPGDRLRLTTALLDSITRYEDAHGQEPSPDLIAQAVDVAYQFTHEGQRKVQIATGFTDSFLDSATNVSPDNGSLQINRAIVSLQNTFTCAIPWIMQVPTDIQSGEGKLIIVEHQSHLKNGGYAANENMDGVHSGKRFFKSNRISTAANTVALGVGTHAGQITSVQLTSETCETVANGATAAKLVKGQAVVYVGGIPVAKEISKTDTSSTISGSVTLASTTYQIGGTINNDTGVYSLTSTPNLDVGVAVLVEGQIDFNRQPELISEIDLIATDYTFLANVTRGNVTVGIDASAQLAREVGLDSMSNLMGSMQLQLGNEDHKSALQYARRIAASYPYTWDMGLWLDTGAQTRGQNMQDISIPLAVASQDMAVRTNVTGVTHLYVNKTVAAWLNNLVMGGRFVPSGIRARASIYRLGTLDGQFEVYYDPDQPETTSSGVTSAEVLLIGQSQDVARSGLVAGQSVSPIMIEVGKTKNADSGVHYFRKDFMRVNPHKQSALAFAKLTLTGMK